MNADSGGFVRLQQKSVRVRSEKFSRSSHSLASLDPFGELQCPTAIERPNTNSTTDSATPPDFDRNRSEFGQKFFSVTTKIFYSRIQSENSYL